MKNAKEWYDELNGEISAKHIKAIQEDAIETCVTTLTLNAGKPVKGFEEVFKLLVALRNKSK